ncbi:MAG: 4Fe-4S dicluster domain-containing protein [bacterium]
MNVRMGMLTVRNGDPEQEVLEIFARWLKSKKLSAILVPAVSQTGVIAPVLISDPDRINQASPFLPAMSVNSAGVVAEIASKGSPDAKLGVFLRPCEMRAVVELIKLQQVIRENLILIGVDCPGTYKPKKIKTEKKEFKDFIHSFLHHQNKYFIDDDMRLACQLCEFPTPLVYDLAIGFLGLDPLTNLLLSSATESGMALMEDVITEAMAEIPKERMDYLSKMIEMRKKKTEEKLAELDRVALGPKGLVQYFADCLNCHNCMKVCPVCYCRQCFFDSDVLEKELDEYIRLSRRKGLNRMPAGTMLYHLTRMNHMMTSCVQCGICEESCPVGIGLTVLYKKVSRNAQAEFDYLPGRSIDEPLPLTTFREDEFRRLGED